MVFQPERKGKKLTLVYERKTIYQPMPAAEADGLLDNALQSDENRLGTIIAGYHHLSVPR